MAEVNTINVPTGAQPVAEPETISPELADAMNRTELGKADPNKEAEVARPEGIPKKFKSVDELAKAYAELEKKLSTPKAPETPEVKAAEPKAPETPKPADAKKSAEKLLSTEDFSKYSDEFIEHGELSTESLETIAKEYKISADMAKHYVEMAKQANDLKAMKLANEFGSMEKYEEVRNWAVENLSEANLKLVTDMASSSNWEDVQAATEFLKHKFDTADHSPINLSVGKPGGQSEGAPFNNMYEQVQAQKDPRYGRDPLYTQSVERRIERATAY